MNYSRAILAIVRKDLEDAFRNQTVLFALVVPILLATMLHKVQNPDDVRRPQVAVFASNDSGMCRSLELSDALKVVRVRSYPEGMERLDSRKAVVLINCSEDFDEQLLKGSFPEVHLTVDPSRPIQVEIVRGELRNTLREQAGQKLSADITVEGYKSKHGSFQESWVAAWILFTTLTALSISASSMGEEKEAGTLQQIIQSPATTSQILIGKAVVGSALATISAALIFVLNASPSASWLNAILLVSLGTTAFSLLGVAIGLLAEGPTAINSWTGLVFIGLFVPAALAETSQTMSRIAVWSPAFYFQDGLLKSLLGQKELSNLVEGFVALSILAVLALGVGAGRLRRLSA